MTHPPPEDFSAARAAAFRGAVARVDAVERTARPAQVDPARGTDLRPLDFPRPDPAAAAIADITQFQSLVYGAERPSAPAASTGREGVAPLAAPEAPLTPADRIVDTLRHLRGLRGL